MHWVWIYKPWLSSDARLGEYWWHYARKMSYYEDLLHDFVMSDLEKTIAVSKSTITWVQEEPLAMDYNNKVVALKMAFQITKAGFIKNHSTLTILLKPIYKLIKRPAKYITKMILLPIISA